MKKLKLSSSINKIKQMKFLKFSFLTLFLFISLISKTSASLSHDEMEAFHQKGYVIVPQLFTPEEIKVISDCIDQLEIKAKNLSKQYTVGTVHEIMSEGT